MRILKSLHPLHGWWHLSPPCQNCATQRFYCCYSIPITWTEAQWHGPYQSVHYHCLLSDILKCLGTKPNQGQDTTKKYRRWFSWLSWCPPPVQKYLKWPGSWSTAATPGKPHWSLPTPQLSFSLLPSSLAYLTLSWKKKSFEPPILQNPTPGTKLCSLAKKNHPSKQQCLLWFNKIKYEV